jgi:hypothetical protein
MDGVGAEVGVKAFDPKRSLVRKLVEVMAVVDRIPKTGHNNFHNYDYTTEADVLEAVRGELARRHVLIVPCVVDSKETAVGDKGQRVFTLKMRFTAHDGESGEQLSWDMYGQGSDSLDKGAFKATTGAVKYGLLKMFLVPTGDDPERDAAHASTTPPPPAGVQGVKSRMKPQPPPPPTQRNGSGASATAVFPNYGRLKGMPIHGAPLQDLQFYRSGAMRTLGDASKARFHDAERALIAQLDAEISAQSRAPSTPPPDYANGADEPPPPTDDDRPF